MILLNIFSVTTIMKYNFNKDGKKNSKLVVFKIQIKEKFLSTDNEVDFF